MKIYIAGAYAQKEKLKDWRKQLNEAGIGVTSRWLDEPHEASTPMSEIKPALLEQYAFEDLLDIESADGILFESVDPEIPLKRGGRHVEFGYALALGKLMYVIGPHENIFHYLPGVVHFGTVDDFIEYTGGRE